MTDPNLASEWTTVPVTIELDRNGGGFIAVDLVAPATLDLTVAATRVEGTKFIAKLSYTAVNLPSAVGCAVKWSIPAPKKDDPRATTDVVGGSVELKGASGTVEAVLDLMTAGTGFGAFLEAGVGDFTLTLHPEWPHVRDGVVAVAFRHKLALRLLAKAVKPPPKPPKPPKQDAPAAKVEAVVLSRANSLAPKIGEVVTVTLDRSDWPCHVRFRVDTPENDVVIVYPPGKAGDQPWRFGCGSAHGLQFPKPKDEKLTFALLLEVSATGKDDEWAAVHRTWLNVPEPTLSSFTVETPSSDDEKNDGKARGHTFATGVLTGFAEDFAPPFWIEPWVITAGKKGGKGARPMHPTGHPRVSIGALSADGAFKVAIPTLSEGTPFAVLRAPPLQESSSEKLTPIGGYIRWKGLRAFSDEDLLDKGVALGVASVEIAKDTVVSRAPVALEVAVEVVGETVTAHADVLGPKSYWSDAKPAFCFQLEGASAEEKTAAATYAPVPGGAHGTLTGSVPFKQLGALAGKVAVVQLRIATGKDAPEHLADATTKVNLVPRIGPITWVVDKDKKRKDQIHFSCRTHMFPEKSEELVATIEATTVSIAPKIVYEIPAPAGGKGGGQVDDDRLEFFIRDAAQIPLLVELLMAGNVKVTVARPDGAKVYGDQIVAPTSDLRAKT